MRRREAITLIGGAVAGLPFAICAQTAPKLPRVGLISSGSPATYGRHVAAFRQALRELGHVEGKTIVVEVRWGEGRIERMPELVDQLISQKMDVLVMANGEAALTAKKLTQTIPIVMLANDPVALGLVATLARPGGNVTGMSMLSVDTSDKRLELLKEIVPNLARVAVLRDSTFAGHALFCRQTEMAAKEFGVELKALNVSAPEDLEAAFANASKWGAHALLAFDGPFTMTNRSKIVELAAKSRIPGMYGFREFVDEGGLAS